MMGFYGGGIGWFGMILCFIFFVLLIAGVILLIIWLVKGGTSPNMDNKTSSNALGVLKERYAKGELTKEQYENMKKNLV